MNTTKRIIITTLFGLASGIAAVGMTVGVGASLPPETIARMCLNFTLMGFAIGASALHWRWALNGLFFGLAFGALEGLASVPAGLPVFIPLAYGSITGLLIESITRVIFKPSSKPRRASAAP